MRTIHKYVVPVEDTATLTMPEGARPIAVAEQRSTLCMWAEVESENQNVEHIFHVRGTGHPMRGDEGQFIGTVVMSYGLVWHVYAAARLAS